MVFNLLKIAIGGTKCVTTDNISDKQSPESIKKQRHAVCIFIFNICVILIFIALTILRNVIFVTWLISNDNQFPLSDNFPKAIFRKVPKISASIMINYDNSAQSFRENGFREPPIS